MTDVERMLAKDYRLTTAEILYRMPDFPALLQSFTWQHLDIAPKFPVLCEFLHFWERQIEADVHSVKVAHTELVKPATFVYCKGELLVH